MSQNTIGYFKLIQIFKEHESFKKNTRINYFLYEEKYRITNCIFTNALSFILNKEAGYLASPSKTALYINHLNNHCSNIDIKLLSKALLLNEEKLNDINKFPFTENTSFNLCISSLSQIISILNFDKENPDDNSRPNSLNDAIILSEFIKFSTFYKEHKEELSTYQLYDIIMIIFYELYAKELAKYKQSFEYIEKNISIEKLYLK